MLFSNIYKHKNIKKKFINLIKKKNFFQSQLFYGPKESSKLVIAIALIKYINCIDINNINSCNICNSCTKINNFIYSNIDLLFPINLIEKNINYLDKWISFFKKNPYNKENNWISFIKKNNKIYISKDQIKKNIQNTKISLDYNEYKFIII